MIQADVIRKLEKNAIIILIILATGGVIVLIRPRATLLLYQ